MRFCCVQAWPHVIRQDTWFALSEHAARMQAHPNSSKTCRWRSACNVAKCFRMLSARTWGTHECTARTWIANLGSVLVGWRFLFLDACLAPDAPLIPNNDRRCCHKSHARPIESDHVEENLRYAMASAKSMCNVSVAWPRESVHLIDGCWNAMWGRWWRRSRNH